MNLDELAKKKKAEYMRQYKSRPENKAKNREYQRNYWRRKALESLESSEESITSISEEDIERKARELKAAYSREYRQRSEYKEKNKEYQDNFWKRKVLEELNKNGITEIKEGNSILRLDKSITNQDRKILRRLTEVHEEGIRYIKIKELFPVGEKKALEIKEQISKLNQTTIDVKSEDFEAQQHLISVDIYEFGEAKESIVEINNISKYAEII